MQFAVRPPDKHRFLDALRRRARADIPYFELEFSPGIVSAFLGKRVTERSYLLPFEDYLEFIQRVGLDVCHLVVPWWLGREKYTDTKGTIQYKTGGIQSRADLGRFVPIDVDFAQRRIEAFLKAREGTNIGWTIALPTAANQVVTAMGYEKFYTGVYDDAEFVAEFQDRIEAQVFPLTETVLRYQPDAVMLAAFACFKTGLAMSPDLTERFIFARIERHMRLLRAAGAPVIIHSDGNNTSVMERWIELGLAGFHPVEPSDQYTIYEYKQRWGDRITLCGNMDCATVLSRGTPDQVAGDTRDHLQQLSPGGGYICGSSHDVDDNVPLENLRAMIETVAHYRHAA